MLFKGDGYSLCCLRGMDIPHIILYKMLIMVSRDEANDTCNYGRRMQDDEL